MTRVPLALYEAVKQLEAADVAKAVGLRKAKERHKWACPVHGGSDSLEAYVGPGAGFCCFVCPPLRGRQWRSYSTIDVAAAAWKVDAPTAVQRLADHFGIRADKDASHPRAYRMPVPGRAGARAPRPNPAGDPLAVERNNGFTPATAEAIYAGVLAAFPALETPAAWAELRAYLTDSYLPGELAAAGLWRDGALALPDEAPSALLPRRDDAGRVVGLRFMSLTR